MAASGSSIWCRWRPDEVRRAFGDGGACQREGRSLHGFAVLEKGRMSRSSKVSRPFRLAADSLIAASRNLVQRAVLREPAYPA